MLFRQEKIGNMHNFSYILGDPVTHQAAIVDPSFDADTLIRILETDHLELTTVILTHGHYDHVQDTEKIIENFPEVKVAVHEKENFDRTGLHIINLEDNSIIDIGHSHIKVIHTPGHTEGSICLLVEHRLLTGDTLFIGGCGRWDLAGGDSKKLFKSLQKIKELPDDTWIYPGHDYGDKPYRELSDEKIKNKYLKANTYSEFMELYNFTVK